MIVENKLSSLNNNPIKVNKKPVPQSINKQLPPLFFTGIWVGSKGTGKSYNLVKLLKNYEQFPIYDISKNKLNIRIILFCPTYHSSANEIFKTLKDLDEADVILNYSDDSLLEILHEIQEEKEEIELYAKYCKAYKQFEKPEFDHNYFIDLHDKFRSPHLWGLNNQHEWELRETVWKDREKNNYFESRKMKQEINWRGNKKEVF